MAEPKGTKPVPDSYDAVQAEFKKKGVFSRFFNKVQPKSSSTTLDARYEIGPRKVRKGLVVVIAALGLGVGGDQVLNQGKFLSSLSGGGEKIVEQVMPQYSGEVEAASQNYYYSGGRVCAVGQDFDANKLEGKVVTTEYEDSTLTPLLKIAKKITQQDTGEVLYTEMTPPTLDDYVTVAERDKFEKISKIAYNKKENWEQYEKGWVFGRYDAEKNQIMVVKSNNDQVIGQILLKETTDYASFNLEKLKDSDRSLVFFFELGETVPWAERSKTKDLFEANLVYVIESRPFAISGVF